LLFAIPFPEIQDEVPKNFRKDWILTAYAIQFSRSPTKQYGVRNSRTPCLKRLTA